MVNKSEDKSRNIYGLENWPETESINDNIMIQFKF